MAANGNRLNAITSCWFGRLRANRRVAPAPEPGACPLKEKRQFLVKSENNYYLCEPKGEVQEWLNWPAWKASKPLKGFRGSNPPLRRMIRLTAGSTDKDRPASLCFYKIASITDFYHL